MPLEYNIFFRCSNFNNKVNKYTTKSYFDNVKLKKKKL